MITRLILILFTSALLNLGASAQSQFLGVLEDVPALYPGNANTPGVRVAFEKADGQWRALPSECPDEACLKAITSRYPARTTWNVVLEGKRVATVGGRTPKTFGKYSHVGLQQVESAGTVPIIGKRSVEYGGFLGLPLFRPLVANSQPFFADPDAWKAAELSAENIALARAEFHRSYPKLCRASEDVEAQPEPLNYRDEDLYVVKSYASRGGWKIVRLHLPDAIDCLDEESGLEIDDPWFVITPQNTAQFLDSGIWLVDTGDYDNDGNSELVFSIDRYNRGGYELFYDNFRKRAVFQFSYH